MDILALEEWVWHGRAVPEAPSVLRLIGALETLTSGVVMLEYPAGEWMRALMGYLPSRDPVGWERPQWKQLLRAEVGAQLGYAWPPVRPSDGTAFHDSDAAGPALYAQAVQRTGCRLGNLNRRVPPRSGRRRSQ